MLFKHLIFLNKMPYKRSKRSVSVLTMRAKMRAQRRKRGMRRFRQQKVFYYKQAVDGLNITGINARFLNQTAANRHIACEFKLSDIPQHTTLASLYDQYQITKIVVKLIPMVDSNGVSVATGGTASNPGVIASVLDYDDVNPLGNLNEYEQYQSFKVQPAISTRPHTRVIYPAVMDYYLGVGGGNTPAGVKRRQWFDCGATGISHKGLKIYIDQQYSSLCPQNWQVFATYYVKFRCVR